MSEMDISESSNECSNDSRKINSIYVKSVILIKKIIIYLHRLFIPVLLDRVFLRLGNADTDEQLENCLNRFLPPVILKLSSPHEQVCMNIFSIAYSLIQLG